MTSISEFCSGRSEDAGTSHRVWALELKLAGCRRLRGEEKRHEGVATGPIKENGSLGAYLLPKVQVM